MLNLERRKIEKWFLGEHALRVPWRGNGTSAQYEVKQIWQQNPKKYEVIQICQQNPKKYEVKQIWQQNQKKYEVKNLATKSKEILLHCALEKQKYHCHPQ